MSGGGASVVRGGGGTGGCRGGGGAGGVWMGCKLPKVRLGVGRGHYIRLSECLSPLSPTQTVPAPLNTLEEGWGSHTTGSGVGTSRARSPDKLVRFTDTTRVCIVTTKYNGLGWTFLQSSDK